MRVTAGAYPLANADEVARVFPASNHTGDWLLAMDWAGVHRLKQLRPNVFCVGRRWQPDPQVDFGRSPESEAERWYGILSASGMNASLDGWLGPNEYFTSSSDGGRPGLDGMVWGGLRRGHWVARFEALLGHRVYFGLRKRYWWGSVPVWNVVPSQYAAYFRDTLNPSATGWIEGPAYHAYCPNDWTRAERAGDGEYPQYVYRPLDWWNSAAGRWRTCLISESGTGPSWRDLGRSPSEYAATVVNISQALDQMRAAGIPVSPPAVFGYGVEGGLGPKWNVDGTAFTDGIVQHNASQAIFPVASALPGLHSASLSLFRNRVP